jgi:hypothetical protein
MALAVVTFDDHADKGPASVDARKEGSSNRKDARRASGKDSAGPDDAPERALFFCGSS